MRQVISWVGGSATWEVIAYTVSELQENLPVAEIADTQHSHPKDGHKQQLHLPHVNIYVTWLKVSFQNTLAASY